MRSRTILLTMVSLLLAAGAAGCRYVQFPPPNANAACTPGTAGHWSTVCDGTVTDTASGRQWAQAPGPDRLNWSGAVAYCDSLELGGHDDWRLPSVRELSGLVEGCDAAVEADCWRTNRCMSCGETRGPANGCYWQDGIWTGACEWYWASSRGSEDGQGRGGVHFQHGVAGSQRYGVLSHPAPVRCVRGARG